MGEINMYAINSIKLWFLYNICVENICMLIIKNEAFIK